ncbi:MAG: S8 family serine peptidase [Alphaproteobacteria bacterium]|nr:S8 family serine peptidase [Alphaproteobacteria bacterium]
MKKPGRPRKSLARAMAAGALALYLTSASWGQFGGLGGGLPVAPILQGVPVTIDRTASGLDRTLQSTVEVVKRDVVGRPLLTGAIDRDPQGARIVRGEILAVSPSNASLAIAKRLNFDIRRTDTLSNLGLTAVILGIPDGMSATDALAVLKKADPQGSYDYDHLYDPSGVAVNTAAPAAPRVSARAGSIRIGMIDGGISRRHPVFGDAAIVTKDVAGERSGPPTAHGTAVASLLIGDDDDFHGYLPGAALYAADAFGGDPTGGSAVDLVRALNWLAEEHVAVVNVSLAGPPNALLQAGVQAFLESGHVLVAAVGNNGPAAPLAYPASYPGVVAVTSVDGNRHLQVDANRGDVTFAAIGVDVRAAALHGYTNVTGTSFAAPVVAARFALLVPAPDPQIVRRACLALEHAALPLGKGFGDPAFGYGYLPAPLLALEANR